MDIDTILTHLQEHGMAYFGVAVVGIPLLVVFRKYTLPVLYHTAEYLIYCTVAHVVIGGLTRIFSWFRGETSFKNYNGDLSPDFVSFTTPLNFDFWQKELYSPQWLFWFEAGVAAILLYVVVVVRPLKFKPSTYKSKRPAPGSLSGRGPTGRYGANPKKLGSSR